MMISMIIEPGARGRWGEQKVETGGVAKEDAEAMRGYKGAVTEGSPAPTAVE